MTPLSKIESCILVQAGVHSATVICAFSSFSHFTLSQIWLRCLWGCDRDIPAVVFVPLKNAFNGSSLDQIFSYSFKAQMPLKMSANSQCLVIDSLCLPFPPSPPLQTCQTCLYLTRRGNGGICHLCKLLHNLIWLAVSDEADSTWLPFYFFHFSQTLLAHLSDGTTVFDRTQDKLGEKVAGRTMTIIISIYTGLLSLV